MKRLMLGLVATSAVVMGVGAAACGSLSPVDPTAKQKLPIAVGNACDCSLDGQKIVCDSGDCYCLDNRAVTKSAFDKYYCEKTWPYTICQDKRDFANCGTDGGAGTGGGGGTGGGVGGAGGTGGSGVSCIPGQQTSCTDGCGANETGYHICQSDGKSYGTCLNCSSTGTGGAGGTAGSAGAAGTGGSACNCPSGQQVNCDCGGTIKGIQVCKADCSGFDTCVCPDGGVGGTGGAGGTGGTAGGAGAAGAGGTGPQCIPGLQIKCPCLEGPDGFQVCKIDGSGYDTCQGCGGGTGGSAGVGGADGGGGTGGSGTPCIPGLQIGCACGGGLPDGTQVCKADGSGYNTCVCLDAGAGGAGGTGGTAGSAGAAGTGGGTPCAPGTKTSCACGGGINGEQVCRADGSGYDPCVCTNLICHDGEPCTVAGLALCAPCEETLNGKPRLMRCQKGIVVIDTPWDPVCYPNFEAGSLANDCAMLGVDGQMTVLVKIGDAPPVGKVLGVFGKVHYYSGNGTNLDYSVWKLGNTGDTQIIATPVPAVAGVELTFEPGFTTAGNNLLTGWTYRCPSTGCPATDSYTACAGKAYVGSLSGGVLDGNCETKLSDNLIFQQLHCWN